MKNQAPETTFERREIKYLLTTVQKEAFMGIIGGYLRPDENGNSGSYRLMSLYFDSPNKDFYRAKWFNLPSRKSELGNIIIQKRRHLERRNKSLLRSKNTLLLLITREGSFSLLDRRFRPSMEASLSKHFLLKIKQYLMR